MANDINQTIDKISVLQSVTNPEWIAIAISIVSAIFAYRSWQESKKANNISKHPMQLEVYDAFNRLVIYVQTEGVSLELLEVSKFYVSSQKSELYFDKNFSEQIKKYFEVCRKLADLNRRYWRDREKNKDIEVEKIYQEQNVLLDKEIMLSKEIEKKFKKVLKL